MKPLMLTFAALALLVWMWSEYFRAIPNLQEAGVLNNFQVQKQAPVSAVFTVIDKRYYSAGQNLIRPTAPVAGGFQHLEYLSNMDVLLSPIERAAAIKNQTEWEQHGRCFTLKAKTGADAADLLSEQLLNLSMIAQNEQAANQLRKLKAGLAVQLYGHWASVQSAKTSAIFLPALGHANSARCKLFVLERIDVLGQ